MAPTAGEKPRHDDQVYAELLGPPVVGADAPEFRASYNYAFSWLGLVGFYLAGGNLYNEVISPSGMTNSIAPTLDSLTIWGAISIGVVAGCFSLWHGIQGSPSLIIDKDGVTGYNLYGRSHVSWADIDFLTFQETEHYGRTLEIRSKHRWLGVIPTGVCYSPKLSDKTAEEVIAAIKLRRPDLR